MAAAAPVRLIYVRNALPDPLFYVNMIKGSFGVTVPP